MATASHRRAQDVQTLASISASKAAELVVQHHILGAIRLAADGLGFWAARSVTTSSDRVSKSKGSIAEQTGQFFGNRGQSTARSAKSRHGELPVRFQTLQAQSCLYRRRRRCRFVDSDFNLGSTTFAFQGILGLGYNWSPNLRFISRPLISDERTRVLPARPGRTTTPACSPASS